MTQSIRIFGEADIKAAVTARDAEWRAAVERVRGTIPRESDEFERALAAIGDAVLNNVLAAMEGR